MDGVLVIDKPAGMTSHDVVDKVRKALRTKKVGHGGTLDPDATGVLLVGVGKATRFLSYAQAAPKSYAARIRFGSSTSTQDASGEVLETRPANISDADIEGVLPRFTGDIEQIPPMVSAVKVDGERLYKKALRGEEVERKPRSVHIYDLKMSGFTRGAEPEVDLEVRCSGGTYIRTLAHDIGAELGCGAHLRTLRRIEANGFSVEDAVPLEEVSPEALRPLTDAVRDLPLVEVNADHAKDVSFGRPLDLATDLDDGSFAAIVSEGRLLGVYRSEGARLLPERVVPA